MTVDHESVTLRPIRQSDLSFLQQLYASTREEEMRMVPWTDEQKLLFLQKQFEAQHAFYQDTFKQASFDLVLKGDQRIGRLYVDDRADEIRIIDIALLPAARGRGIGSRLMREILDRAANVGHPVSIHVEKNNPALALYHRLGFIEVEDQGVYFLMEWRGKRD